MSVLHTIGPRTSFVGDIMGAGDLTVRGSVEGRIELDGVLTVELGGTVHADAKVTRLRVVGSFQGSVSASERVQIEKTGKVAGELLAPMITMEAGSAFKGKMEIVDELTSSEPPATRSTSFAATRSTGAGAGWQRPSAVPTTRSVPVQLPARAVRPDDRGTGRLPFADAEGGDDPSSVLANTMANRKRVR